MNVIVYGDFNCLHCYLASQRADQLARTGKADVEWRAVEHRPWIPVTGTEAAARAAGGDDPIAEAARLALPGDRLPPVLPAVVSNTRAAVAAYAEAITDGVQNQLRLRLFESIWVRGRNLSSPQEVRRVITELLWPTDPIDQHLVSPDLPQPLMHEPDLWRIVRREGGTVSPNAEPLTTEGYERVLRWRQQWLALPQQVVPTVINTDGTVHAGSDALRCLAGIAGQDVGGGPAATADTDTDTDFVQGVLTEGQYGSVIPPPPA